MAEGTKQIVVVGSINMDLVVHTHHIPLAGETTTGTQLQMHPGGKGANQAVAVARLGYPVQLIGKVGSDVFGRQLLEHLTLAGVDTTAIAVADGSSGAAVIAVAADGENSIMVVPGANALVTPEFLDVWADSIRNAGIVLAQLEIPLESILHLADLCARNNVPLMLDPAPARELPEHLFSKLAWLTPNETEAAFFMQPALQPAMQPAMQPGKGESITQLAHGFLAKGSHGVIVKLGSKGALITTRAGGDVSLPPFAVRAIDTTAAGDAFNGAFAAGLMLGKSTLESGRFAAAAAALSVTREGAQPSMPTRAEVEEFLRERSATI